MFRSIIDAFADETTKPMIARHVFEHVESPYSPKSTVYFTVNVFIV